MNTSASLQCHCVDPLVASSKCAENSNSAEQQLACTEMGPATKGRKRYEGSLRMLRHIITHGLPNLSQNQLHTVIALLCIVVLCS